MTIRAIWTDFGGVLTPPLADALDRVATAAGVPPAALLAAIRRAAPPGRGLLEGLELGTMSQRDWGRSVAAELAPAHTPDIDLADWGDYWYADRPLNATLYAALLAAKARGYRLGMLTNSVAEWEPHRRAMLPAEDAFECVVRSHEVGVRKPDPAIFRLAEDAFGVPAAGCLLIDDLAANCTAARARGWHAIEHADTADTLAELARLLP